MKRLFTLPNLLRLVCYVQLVVMWAYGLLNWFVGTLVISTVYLVVQLAWHDFLTQQAEVEERRGKR